MPKRRLVLILLLIVLATLVVVAVLGSGKRPDKSYRPDGWGSPATLNLREDGTGALLFAAGIRFIEPPVGVRRVDVYRLDWGSFELTPTTQAVWDAAAGPIVECERAGLASRSSFSVADGELRVSGKTVSMRGVVRHARSSASGAMIAALSASGVSTPNLSPIPALGGGSLVGWRFHQFVAAPSGELPVPRVTLGFRSSDYSPCWTPDERAVIYANAEFTEVELIFAPR